MKYICSLDNTQPMYKNIKTSATVTAGQLLVVASGVVAPAGAAATGVIGLAMADAASGAEVQVLLLNNKSVIRVPYTAGTKTSLVAADRFVTSFDIDSNQKMLLDDTTGGILKVVEYNNTAKTADVVVSSTVLWNA